MLEQDLRAFDSWVKPLKESLEAWGTLRQRAVYVAGYERGIQVGRDWMKDLDDVVTELKESVHNALFHHVGAYPPEINSLAWAALESSRKRRESRHRKALKEILSSYLSYVNSNIVLSRRLGAGIYDWEDYQPFYQQKFLTVGHSEQPSRHQVQQVNRLFEVAFPDLRIRSIGQLLKVLTDRRIVDLRRIVDGAVRGEVTFDDDYARHILIEVLDAEQRINKLQRMTGYLTLPLGLVPYVGTGLQKVVEEMANRAIESRFRRKHQWFYLLRSATSKEPTKQATKR